jgi:amino acid transporter
MSSPAPIRGSLAKDRLGVPSVVFFVMSAAAPLMVVAGVVTTGYAQTQITGIPLSFVAVAIILMFFSVGYVAMSRHITNAGAFYTYVSNGLGRPLGVAAAWIALLAYNALQVGLYGIVAAAVTPLLNQWFHLNIADNQWWIIAVAAWAIVAVLGVLRVDINGKVLAVLLCAEVVIVFIYDFADLAKPGPSGVALDTLMPGNLFVAGFGAVLVLTFLGFTGFESAVVFSEESKNPRRTIAVATYLAVGIIGVTYAVSAWAMSVATGPGDVVNQAQQQGPGLLFGLADGRLPHTFVDIGNTLFATSVLASMISFHNTVARYTFALGRERVFPSMLSATGRRSGAPIAGSVVQSVIGLVVIVLYSLKGWDPVVQLFFWIGTAGGFGILLLVALTSIAVIFFFARNSRQENVFRRFVAPLLAAVALITMVYFAFINFHNLLGVAPDDPLRYIIPAAYPVVGLLGFIWALVLKGSKPDIYSTIGLGANSVTGLAEQSRVLPAQQPQYAPQHGGGQNQDIYR